MIIKYHGFVDCCFGKQLKCLLIDPHRNMYCENVIVKKIKRGKHVHNSCYRGYKILEYKNKMLVHESLAYIYYTKGTNNNVFKQACEAI